MTRSWQDWTFVAVVAVLGSLRMYLTSDLAVYALGDAIYDDRLFVNLAARILHGGWLGHYDQFTLVKGFFYPYWIAGNRLLGLPLMQTQQMLYVAACIAFVQALRPLVISRWLLLLLLAVLLFNPVSYAEGIVTRVIRSGIYSSLTLLSLAGFVRLAVAAHVGERLPRSWAYVAGFSTAAFWFTREEGVWLVPSLGLLLLFALVTTLRAKRLDRREGKTLALPIAIPVVTAFLIAVINLASYGVFRHNDLMSGAFGDAYGALARVKADAWDARVPVPRSAREKIYRVSPAFDRLRSSLDGPALDGFRVTQREDGGMDIGGAHFLWALRYAAALQGEFATAGQANEYFRTLANEVDAACDSGRLDCREPRSGFIPPWDPHYTSALLETVGEALRRMAVFYGVAQPVKPSSGTDIGLEKFRELVLGPFTPMLRDVSTGRVQGRGWTFSPLGPVELTVRDADGPVSEGRLEQHLSSIDVYQAMRAEEFDDQSAKRARFAMDAVCESPCWLEVVVDGRTLDRFPLDGSKMHEVNENYRLLLDIPIPQALLTGTTARDRITQIYGGLVPWFAGLALVLFIFETLRLALYRERLLPWVILAALLGSVLSRVGLISIIDVTSFYAITPQYLSAAYAPGLAFLILAVLLVIRRPLGARPST